MFPAQALRNDMTRDLPRSSERTVTMVDVARHARVSVATVSRVLNTPERVAPDKSAAVREAVRELEFRPNLAGRTLRAARTRTLGVVLPTLSHPVFAECLHGIEVSARERGYSISIATTGYEPAQEHQASEMLLQRRVDAMVLTVADARHSRVLDKLDAEAVPYVLVYNQLGRTHSRRSTVSVDNRVAARQMVEHLIGLGHRRILMLAGNVRQSDRSRQRVQGYGDAMRAAGLTPLAPIELAFMAPDATAHLGNAILSDAPTALFCSSDQLALLAIRDLAALGLAVPADISVAGFDGTSLSALMVPPLTTVVQPSIALGRAAVERVIALLDGARIAQPTVLTHELRLGATAAPPRP
jgi:DNA-binding LacI/PurR family transcriptional regulator